MTSRSSNSWNRAYGDPSGVSLRNAKYSPGVEPPVSEEDYDSDDSVDYTSTYFCRSESAEDNMQNLGATFVPGGFDDYYMPVEVVAPAPQRVMPEVPQNMQDDLQRMELEAREPDNRRAANDAYTNGRGETYQSFEKKQGEPTSRGLQESASRTTPLHAGSFSSMDDAPSFSPFPRVKGENIPPSNEEMEETLSQARVMVLHSNNVPMQIAWARDTLAWVEIQAEAQAREWKQKNKGRGERERPGTPKVEHDLRVDAVSIIQYLASQDHPEATFMRAKWLEFGKFGQRENKKEAYLGYKKAAALGWGRAEYRIGMLYENSNDADKAVKHYNQGIALKDSAASYRLGMMFLLGQHGYPKDYERGLEMIQVAADSADSDAPQGAYVYGMLIARELPDIDIPDFLLPVDLSLARQYIEKAAYLGFAKAQLKMGQAYELSQLGCDFKPTLSLHYYALAARQGQAEAALGVSRWFLFGYEKEFLKNEKLAFQYGEAAADAGLPTGEFAMGYYYEIGIHVPKDVRQARIWYERAAEHGNKDSVRRLEELDNSRTLTKKDHETTTLTRIKSQHGSQRGKRPERFSRPNEKMQAVPESPVDDEPRPAPPVKVPSPPRPSPPIIRKPVVVEEHIEFPDPERQSAMARPPAFTINLDQNNLAMGPKSVAPYPDDDRPPALNVSRPKSTAPYPDDDVGHQKPQLSPYFNASIRPSSAAGPQADRPMSAFGIRPLATNQNLQPTLDPRGRPSAAPVMAGGLAPQAPSGYRQPSPGPRIDSAGYRQSQPLPQQHGPPPPQHYDPLPSQRLTVAGGIPPAGTTPISDPTRNRLTKTNPSLDKPQPGPPGQFPTAGYGVLPGPQQRPVSAQPPIQPGRDYGVGPRTSSRLASDTYDRYGAGPPPAPLSQQQGRPPQPGSRVDSLPPHHQRTGSNPSSFSSQPQQQQPLKPIPPHLNPNNNQGGRSGSAPPAQNAVRPSPGPSQAGGVSSTHSLPGKNTTTTTAAHPEGPPKKTGQGPATFEEMGIPLGKNESDCVVM